MDGMTFLHSGGCGDVIYSLPLVKRMGGGTFYLKPQNNYNASVDNFKSMKPLLEAQDYIESCVEYPLTPIHVRDETIYTEIDLDEFRNQPRIAHNNLVGQYFRSRGIEDDTWRGKPWIDVGEPMHPNDIILPEYDHSSYPYILINRTLRYQDPSFSNWTNIVSDMKEEYNMEVYFMGLDAEYIAFTKEAGLTSWVPTHDALIMARLIKGCEALYCNQSLALTLAQALNKKYYLEVAPGHSNTIMDTPNEMLLNR